MLQIIEHNYLLKVLTLNGVPKLITFALTLLCFPLMVRALGAENYGALVFIAAALSLFEVLMDFGVSSASGKAMAEVRTHQPGAIRRELFAWARLQMMFVAGGFGPMLLGAYLLVQGSPAFQDTTVLWILATGVCFSVAVNFLRANLQSLLAFKSLAVLDTTESVIRSSGLLVVAFLVPTVMGLAVAGLVTTVLSSTLAVVLIVLQLKNYQSKNFADGDDSQLLQSRFTLKTRLRESINFLWLRFSTRLFQEGPNIIFGRFLGAEVVGIVSAFRKIIEILSTPYLIIGNGLMVRIHEVARQGPEALLKLWDGAMNIATTGLFFAFIIYIAADGLAYWLLPDTESAPEFFGLMSLMATCGILFALIAPMSDYLGGLIKRNIFLTAMSVVQAISLTLAVFFGNAYTSVLVFVLMNFIVAIGYALIASKVFFHNYKVHIPAEALLFFIIILASMVITETISYVYQPFAALDLKVYVLDIIIFVMITFGLLFMNKRTRRYFLYLGMFNL